MAQENTPTSPTNTLLEPLDGLYYALYGNGGYVSEQGLKDISMIPLSEITKYDMTDSVQIMFDVRTFNKKLGIIKDASNINIMDTSFNMNTNKFPNDSISISANDFIAGVTSPIQVISVGKCRTLYSDFITYINDYFGYANGFSTLFNLSNIVDINSGVFDSQAFIHIINGKTLNTDTGEYINDLSGSITVSYINNILNYMIYGNPFNNRPNESNNENIYNTYLQQGFLEDDLIFIPLGLTITLNLKINNNNINLNNLGYNNISSLNNSYNYTNGYFSSNTVTTKTDIKRIVKAPLLIKLMNLS